jgi:hypothetical protein
MGKPMRRLRPLLPRQARGRGHGRDSFHGYWLQAARRQDMPMHRLSAPPPEGSRLREADGGRGPEFELAAGHLRLSVGGQGRGPVQLASAGVGFARQRARGGDLSARPGFGQRDRPCSRILAGPDRQMAEPQAARPALRSGLRRRAQQTFGEEIVLRLDARQDEEISAADRLDILLQPLAVETRLQGEKA